MTMMLSGNGPVQYLSSSQTSGRCTGSTRSRTGCIADSTAAKYRCNWNRQTAPCHTLHQCYITAAGQNTFYWSQMPGDLWTPTYHPVEADWCWCTVGLGQHRDPLSLEKHQWPHALVTYCRHGNTPSWGTSPKKKKVGLTCWVSINKQVVWVWQRDWALYHWKFHKVIKKLHNGYHNESQSLWYINLYEIVICCRYSSVENQDVQT